LQKNDQSNSAKGAIAVVSAHNSSFVFARWQHMTDGLAAISNCMFWLGVRTFASNLTQYVFGPHKCTCQMASTVNPSIGLSRGYNGDRQADDRQTDNAMEK